VRRAGWRELAVVALAGALGLAGLAACSGSGDDGRAAPSTTATTEAPTTTTTVPLPVPPPITWSGCGGGFRCATLAVPVDYAQPAGEQLQLSLIQRPAGDPARRIGTLVLNPGGPGASGVRRVRRGFTLTPEVADRFDIVSFDPRGVGGSTPVTCGSSVAAFRAVDHAPTTPEGQAALEAAAKGVADECQRTEGARLAHLGTYEVVRDLEELRMGLREPTVSFVGISYGTFLGLLWADAFPRSVRAMVLDGVQGPDDDGPSSSTEQVRDLDTAFGAIADACAKDPSCPTTADGGVVAAYDALAQRIAAAGGTLDGVGLTQLRYAVFMATYGSEHWPDLWRALHRGMAGDLDGIAALSRQFTGLVSYAPFAIVTCLDTSHREGPEAWRRDARVAAAVSPRFGAALSNELLPCAFLPEGHLGRRHIEAKGAPPILVVGSTGDVATPYDQAVAVADQLDHGVLLTVDLAGHVAIGASDCAEAVMTRYLVDGTPPASGTRC
jgi:pimeloyl-ACP methyl ester carboxylesterase